MREDWVECTLGDVFDFVGGGTPSKSNPNYWSGNIPWASIKDLKGDHLIGTQNFITEEGLKNSSANIANKNEIILATRISPGTPILSKIKTAINQDLKVAKPKIQSEIDYYFWLFNTLKPKILKLSSGTTVLGINLTNLKSIRFLLPPISIQRAIVAKIEELFSDLDKGIADLKKAQAQLKIYRQAVLKKAFEGELTKQWREQQINLPSADALLEQIKEERQKHYAQQLENWKQAVKAWEDNGKEGKKPGKPKKEKEFESFKTDIKLNELPNNWKWCDLGEVTAVSGGLTKNSKRTSLKVQKPFLRVANVYFNSLDLQDMHSIGVKEDELSRVTLKHGDLLLVEGNGSVGQIGRTAIWRGEIPSCIHQNHLIKARPFSSINSSFLLYFLCSKMGRDLIIQVASSTSGLHTLNLTKVYNLKIPLCSQDEQHQIVQEIESRLSVCDKVEQSISESLEKAKALRQSILKKAFAGSLLSAEEIAACKAAPDYEPASVLLEKIKAAKATKQTKVVSAKKVVKK